MIKKLIITSLMAFMSGFIMAAPTSILCPNSINCHGDSCQISNKLFKIYEFKKQPSAVIQNFHFVGATIMNQIAYCGYAAPGGASNGATVILKTAEGRVYSPNTHKQPNNWNVVSDFADCCADGKQGCSQNTNLCPINEDNP